MIVDTHCHYNLRPLFDDVQKLWLKAKEDGIEAVINVGTDLKTSQDALELASNHPEMYASIGLHPGNFQKIFDQNCSPENCSQEKITQLVDEELENLAKILHEHKSFNNFKLLAIGEIGLDYYRLKNKGLKREAVKETQKLAFESQLKMARDNHLVAIIHVRDQKDRLEDNAYYDTLEILKKISTQRAENKLKFVLHCVSGPQNYIDESIKLGGYIGIGGNITYENAEDLRKIVNSTPKDRHLLETDAPYLVPRGCKGDFCEPRMIKTTAKYLEQEMGLNLDIIRDNTRNLFGI